MDKRNFFKCVLRIGLAGCISILLLSIFALFYDYSGVHITNYDGDTDFKWESNQFRSNMTEGFSWLIMDSNGYNNAFPNTNNRRIDVLLMGSSQMEAVNVAAQKNTGYLLNELLPSYYTYNIGISGQTFYRCVDNIRNAYYVFSPEKYIVIETSTISLDTSLMKEVLEGRAIRDPSYDSGLMYNLQKYIPGVKLLYESVSDWINVEQNENANKNIQDDNSIRDIEYVKILDEFLKYASQSAECQLIIFYKPSTQIDQTGSLISYTDSDRLEQFSQVCRSNGILFIDGTDAFAELYNNNHVLVHGFNNTKLGSGHLNENGHRCVAEEIAKVISADQNNQGEEK